MPKEILAKLPRSLAHDFSAGLTVFFIALPLCLGVALASNAPIIAGLLSGIVGGAVVGALSKSHTSISGPSAGLTAVIAFQITALGSFEAFLGAVFIAGIVQIMMGMARMGFVAEFFPNSVIKGLLAAIGIILVLKQLPHLVGFDADFEGDMAFLQPDHENTFSEIYKMLTNFHLGSMIVGLLSLCFLLAWDRISALKKSPIPSALVVVVLGMALSAAFSGSLVIGAQHRVDVPIINGIFSLPGLFSFPDWAQINYNVVFAGISIAMISSLETLLNLSAIDKIDPYQRKSPPNRELLAQGIGNMILGLIGGLPTTSAVVRSSVNINAKAQSKLSAIVHGLLLLISVLLLPNVINLIPLSCLAAILIVTGLKLASLKTIRSMWKLGLNQFLPFSLTLLAILFTDLLVGVLIGLAVSIFFILKSNFKHQTRLEIEHHLGYQLQRIILPSQVNFLNKAALARTLENIPQKSHVAIDASDTDYIDADVLDMIKDFESDSSLKRQITLSLLGFKSAYEVSDSINHIDYATFELQQNATPKQVLKLLKEGNQRVRQGRRIKRDLNRQILGTSAGQYPVAVILSCIDSRVPVELVFDLGIGDIFSVRMAGNVVSEKVLGSLEFATALAGAKLIVVMGHTKCGAVSAALDAYQGKLSDEAHTCKHLGCIIDEIKNVAPKVVAGTDRELVLDGMIEKNVLQSIHHIRQKSSVIADLLAKGHIDMVGCIYDVTTGAAHFIDADKKPLKSNEGVLAVCEMA
jgi:carbonic anhydrase